jgi:lysyl-tRNA synthetase class 2
VSGPLRFVRPLGAEAVSLTTGAFGLLACGAAAVLLLRPGSRRPDRPPTRTSVCGSCLAGTATPTRSGTSRCGADKSLMWAPSGRAAIAYRVINGVSLASGEPIGDRGAWPDAIAAWLADCSRHGWTPAVLACGHAGGQAYRRSGLDVIELGDEAILDATAFSLQGRPMRGVRQAVNRMRRAGYTCTVVRQRELPAGRAGRGRTRG